ncbi:caspase domain-containing protein [Hypomontagnella monticulosa]|nr:caspase domain-containing protein [Hypomontagnella monticulosa]
MDNERTTPEHWAILIGINAYKEKPLKGAVRDVQDIRAFLEGALSPLHTRIFTATRSTDPGLLSPTEGPELLPTYDNVVSAFKEITTSAKDGDFVYIHYSGHGTREIPHTRSYNQSTGDIGLILLAENEENPVRYLFGRSLAYSLNAMVRKGLVVTVVLDCCFSASIYRHGDPNIRFLPYDFNIGSLSTLGLSAGLVGEAGYLAMRDASMQVNWLINTDKHALLVACGPNEEASEIQEKDGQVHGALSYFLLRTLRGDNSLGDSLKSIHDSLYAEFRNRQLHQNPALYGNKNQAFFGHPSSDIPATTILVNRNIDGSLELQAGQAHGVSEGDTFSLYPLVSTKVASREKFVIAKVTQAKALASILELLVTSSTDDETSWKARALTRLLYHKFAIQLASSLLHRDEWLNALNKRSLIAHAETEKRPFALRVALNNNQEYEIRDGSDQKLVNLPSLPERHVDIDQISGILEHLVKFQLVRDLRNEAAAAHFQQSFDIKIFSNGTSFGPNSRIEVKHDTIAELVVENRGSKDLYVFLYDLGPFWYVENIYRGPYVVVMPKDGGEYFKGILKRKLRMSVPVRMIERGDRSCEDIIKVFVTISPTSFDSLELPRLNERAKTNKADRTGHKSGDTTEDWVAINFYIQTLY